jgi:hypothetical protein
MKPKLMLLAAAAMLVATNAQAGFLSRESQHCTSNRPYGIYKPGSTRQGNCDVAANRAAGQPVAQAARPYVVVGAPASLIGVPDDTVSPLVQKEIDAAKKQTPASLPAITRDPRLLQYLPKDFFNRVSEPEVVIAAFNRLVRVEPYYINPPLVGFRVLAERLRCLAGRQEEIINGLKVCKIGDDSGV